ncbi:MAG TPA: ABC transporter ATP-binding protein [Deltaproteobacteria bacterium]|nr:ABC transporter ATP-binding protein [Deltaproteobacteria bacterium]
MQSFIKVENLTKSYGGLKAIEEITLEIRKGEILSLVGDNGAGKSTFVKTLAGAQLPDSGHIEIDGEDVRLDSPKKAGFYGIGCLHQGLGLIDTLNVPENVFLGRELQKKVLGIFPQLDYQRMRTETRDLLNQFSIKLPKLNDAVVNLSGGQRQTIAISRLLLQKVKLVIMDEPMAALGVEEGSKVFNLIEKMRSENVSVLIISHNLEHVLKLSDRIAVMKNGKLIKVLEAQNTSREEVVKLITFGLS